MPALTRVPAGGGRAPCCPCRCRPCTRTACRGPIPTGPHTRRAQMALVLTAMTWLLLLPGTATIQDPAARRVAVEGILNFGSYNQHGVNIVRAGRRRCMGLVAGGAVDHSCRPSAPTPAGGDGCSMKQVPAVQCECPSQLFRRAHDAFGLSRRPCPTPLPPKRRKVFLAVEGWLASLPIFPAMSAIVSLWCASFISFALARYAIYGR